MKQSKLFLGLIAGTLLLAGCAKKPLTAPLFFQTGRAHIYLPTNEESKAAVLAERSDIQVHTDTIRPQSETTDTDKSSITLETFTVVADRPLVKISTVRNGYVNLSFLVTLPKIFMHEKYQVVLRPTLLNGDLKQEMPPLVLQGSKFRKLQDKQYAMVDSLAALIVDSARYDSVYFDSPRYQDFAKTLQRRQLRRYKLEYNHMLSYQRWRKLKENRKISLDMSNAGSYDARHATRSLSMLLDAFQVDIDKGDSATIRSKYERDYTPERRAAKLAHLTREIRLKDIPRSYRSHYQRNWTLDSLNNKNITHQDSLDISKYTFDHKAIAKNESLRDNIDIYRRQIIKLPRVENPHSVDSMQLGKDLVYMYSRNIEVKEAIQRRLNVILDTRVSATDESTWMQMDVDTLTFIVSGMNDLADKTLIERLEGEKRAEYQVGLDRLAAYDYKGALDILNHYPDFNSAVCLAALGYNDHAISLLDKLHPASARMDYLRAIIYARMKRLEEAKDLLISSAKRDMQTAFKAEIEPEFEPLWKAYPDLNEELQAIADGDYH